MMYHCSYCSYRCGRYRCYMRHVFESHSSIPNFEFTCGINSCVRKFTNYNSLKSHVTRNHYGEDPDASLSESVVQSESSENDVSISEVDGFEDVFASQSAEESQTCTVQSQSVNAAYELQKSSALYLLTLKEKYKLTQTAIDFVVGHTKLAIDNIIDDLYQNVTKEIMDISVLPGDDKSRISSVFHNTKNPFSGLETQYLQSKYFEENFAVVQPISILLGTSLEAGVGSRLMNKQDSYQYIPLIDGLISLLSNNEIFSEVLKSHKRSDGKIGDYCDAELYKSIPLFQHNKQSLQIILFFDEMEISNPLGSQAGIHKLGLFYYTLGNIRPQLRSTFKAIQLVACVTCTNLKKYGFDKILTPFIEDVNRLSQEGFSIKVNENNVHFNGGVLLLLADTLAAHQIGGFKVGVSFALRKCRDCLASAKDMSDKFLESDFTLRNPASHDYHCSLLDGILSMEDSITYGVNHNSALNRMDSFHVANGQIPQDVMHVILEGVLNLETRLLIYSFVHVEKFFTLELLNERITNFPYGRSEKRNKPPRAFTNANLSGSKLPLSASEMWTFSVLLPFIIGDKVAHDHSKWDCFLLLLEIVKYSTAQLTSSESSEYLTALIDQHHRDFKKCYPSVSMTPKMHYMVHLPRMLINIGPLVNCWCMRMEAKHSYFKRIAQIGNFKNIPYSIAIRHQRLLCANLQGRFFDYENLQFGPCSLPNEFKDEPNFIQDAVSTYIPTMSSESVVVRPTWIKIYGEEYHRGDFVHLGWQNNDLPEFGKIFDIVIIAEFPFVCVEKYKSLGINQHILGYLIEHTYINSCVYLSTLPYKNVVDAHSYIGDGGLYVVLKSHLEQFNPNA